MVKNRSVTIYDTVPSRKISAVATIHNCMSMHLCQLVYILFTFCLYTGRNVVYILKVLEVCPDIPAACSDYNSLLCSDE